MTAFERLSQLRNDYVAAWNAVNAARQTAKDITAAARERLEAEKAQTAARIAELEEVASDLERTATVRRMAEADLLELRERTFSPNTAETAAFMNELATAQQAYEDLRQLKDEVKSALAAAEKELAEIRGAVLGDQNLVLIPRWLDGERAAFEKLGGVCND